MNTTNHLFNRRTFLTRTTPALGALLIPGLFSNVFSATAAFEKLKTRGVVLAVEDLESLDWPLLAHKAGLTTIGTHITPSQVSAFITSPKGQQFLADCRKYKIEVEHELHAMRDLLPRNLFEKKPDMFRMNEQGVRVPDFNCCVSSKDALDIIAENAVKYAEVLTPTTGRYFYWIDDAVPMCKCSSCKDLSDSEQALIIENAMIRALRRKDPNATLAHLAYVNTMPPPQKVKPEPGIFLEFAPIYRQWDKPLSDSAAGIVAPKQGSGGMLTHGQTMELLKENLQVFPADTAQVLEYWLDVSLQSKWKKPAVKVDWHPDVCSSDIRTYEQAGIRHVTTFAVYIDGAYKNRYKDLDFINEYGNILKTGRVRKK
ncbi:DUF4838 domain-containing protein [Chitinophaga sp. MM2321]|uniref:DUF4838 domain-containing protein n=1 Tax=Chitinophaga sp. MM2321 TaxID=3137178 RepID=UPI0032D5ACFD